MESSPINPLVQLQSTLAVGRETEPLPPQLAKLPPDSLLDAVVLRQEPGHIVRLASALGEFRIKAEVDLLRHLLRDSSVTLRILNQEGGTHARIVTVNGTPVHQLNAPKGESPSVIVDTSTNKAAGGQAPLQGAGNHPAAAVAGANAPRAVGQTLTQALPNPAQATVNAATISGITSTANPALKPVQTLSVTLAGAPNRDQAALLVGLLTNQQGQSAPPPGSGQHVLVRLYQLAQPQVQAGAPVVPSAATTTLPQLSAAPTSTGGAVVPNAPLGNAASAAATSNTGAATVAGGTSQTVPPSPSQVPVVPNATTQMTVPGQAGANVAGGQTSNSSVSSVPLQSQGNVGAGSVPTPPNAAVAPVVGGGQPTTPALAGHPIHAAQSHAVHAYEVQNHHQPRPLLPVTVQTAQAVPAAPSASAGSNAAPQAPHLSTILQPGAGAASAPAGAQQAPQPLTVFSHAAGQFQVATQSLSPSLDLSQPVWVEVIPPEQASERATSRHSQWDGVRQLLQAVSTSHDALALLPQLRAMLPQPSLTLPHTTLFLMTMLRGGDMRQWMGQELLNRLEQLPASGGRGGNASTAAMQDVATMQRLFNDTANTPWQVLMLPMLVKEDVQPARLFLKPRKPSRDGERETTRFIIELSLSTLGQLQLDNLFTAPKHPSSSDLGDLSLTIRSDSALDEEIQDDLRQLYYITLDQLSLTGRCQFIHGQAFPTASMDSVVNRTLQASAI